jgi:hypothetical protein
MRRVVFLHERRDPARQGLLWWPELRQSTVVCQDKERSVAKSSTAVSKWTIGFLALIEFFTFDCKLHKCDDRDRRKQRKRKFLFDKLRLPLLGFTHAYWEIERNPY